MASTIPATEPTIARAGDTWTWKRTDLTGDYPASAWALVYAFRNASAYIDISATAQADESFLISVQPATTAAYTAGRYDWVAWAQQTEDDGGEIIVTARHQIDSGQINVLPDLSTAVAHDSRTWARRMLDAVEAALESRATADQLDLIDMAAGDRSTKRDRSSLIELRSKLVIEVRRAEGTGGRPQRIVARFY